MAKTLRYLIQTERKTGRERTRFLWGSENARLIVSTIALIYNKENPGAIKVGLEYGQTYVTDEFFYHLERV